MKSIAYFFLCMCLLFGRNGKILSQTVKDVDGNIYKTITIGEQTWMNENLNVAHYNNGDIIDSKSDTAYICDEKMPKYQWTCSFDNKEALCNGRIYTWFAITDTRNVCPVGWHVPSSAEWSILKKNLGMVDTITYSFLSQLDSVVRKKYISKYVESKGFLMLSGMRNCNGNYFNFEFGTWFGIREGDLTEASILSFSPIYWKGQCLNTLNNEMPAVSVRCLKN